MGIIGNNAIGGSTPTYTSATTQRLLDAGGYTYVAPANEEVHRLWVYLGGLVGDGSGVEIGVYDIASGTNNAPLVASGTLTSLSSNSWNSLDITPVALTQGNTYAIAFSVKSATDFSARSTYVTGGASTSSLTGTSALAATWTDNGSSGEVASVYAETQTAAPSRSITNIDGDNDVQAGQTNITVTTVGMDSAPTIKTATLGGESLTVVSAGETSWVVSVPLHIDLEWGSTTNDLVLTDDTGSVALNNVTLSVPTGWESVAFTTAPNPATTESFYEYAQTDTGLGGAGYTMLAGDVLAWETQTGLTIDGQTIPQVDPPATVSGSYKIFKDATKTWTSVSTFTINDLGVFGGASIPAASRTSVFQIANYLRSLGTYNSSQCNELVVEWLVSEGITRTQINQMLYGYLGGLGYTGSFNDRLKAWSEDA